MPNLERMVSIWNGGRVAVLFYGVDATRETTWPEMLGWTGQRVHIRPITRQKLTRFVNAIDAVCTDRRPVARWLRRKQGHRLLVFLNAGTLCLNFDSEAGFIPEPDTT